MHQSPLGACPCLFACGLVVEDHLELVFLGKKYDILLGIELLLGVLIFFPLNSIGIEPSFKTNTLILAVPSLLAYNFLKLLTPARLL